MNEKYTNEKSIRIKIILIKRIRMKKVKEWIVYEWKAYRLKIVEKEKQSSKSTVFLTKPNRKCTQPNKTVVLLDSRCTWSNMRLGYGNVAIHL